MIVNSDLQKWQQAIKGIEAAQNELSQDELLSFRELTELYNNGNFESVESSANIRIIKSAVQQHAKNRLLKAYLTNFVSLCEKYFNAPPVLNPPTFEPPVEVTTVPEIITEPPAAPPPIIPPIIQPPMEETAPPVLTTLQLPDKTKERKSSRKSTFIFAAIVLLIAGWWVYHNWESDPVLKVRNMLGLVSSDTTKNAPIDTIKQITEQVIVLDTVPLADSIAQVTVKDTTEKMTVEAPAAQDEQRNPSPLPLVKTYSFGKYSGSLKNGIPEGEGTMYYTRHTQIAKHASNPYYAESGDVFVGTWGNGDIVNGKLFDKNNNMKATILAGRRPNPYNIGKN